MSEKQRKVTANVAESMIAQARNDGEVWEILQKSRISQGRPEYKSLIGQGNEPEEVPILDALAAQRQIELQRANSATEKPSTTQEPESE